MLPNYLRAIHNCDFHDPIVVVIIAVFPPTPHRLPDALYVRSDGTLGVDSIVNFQVTAGAWEEAR